MGFVIVRFVDTLMCVMNFLEREVWSVLKMTCPIELFLWTTLRKCILEAAYVASTLELYFLGSDPNLSSNSNMALDRTFHLSELLPR